MLGRVLLHGAAGYGDLVVVDAQRATRLRRAVIGDDAVGERCFAIGAHGPAVVIDRRVAIDGAADEDRVAFGVGVYATALLLGGVAADCAVLECGGALVVDTAAT